MSRNASSYVPSIELFLKYPFAKVRYRHSKDRTCQFTPVSDRIKFAFHGFTFKDWADFNKDAAKVWTGTNAKQIDDHIAMDFKSCVRQASTRIQPEGEDELRASFHGYVLGLLNDLPSSASKWRFGKRQKLDCEPSSRLPDLRCESMNAGSSSSQTRDNLTPPVVNGEMKVPSCLRLGSRLTAKSLTKAFDARDFMDNKLLNPYYQALSYGLFTSKGLAILTNYEEIRFFKINIATKEILMSPVVKVDQVLDVKKGVPHAAQTFLYMDKIEYPKSNEFSRGLADHLMVEGDAKATEHENKKNEKKKKEQEKKEKKDKGKKEKKSSRGSSSKDKGSSSGGDKKGKKHAEVGGREIFTPVSRVLLQCKMIGTVGVGVTGELTECDFNGLKVVVKTGQQMSLSDEKDGFFHVKQEGEIYDVLKELQGRVIPRMVIAGFETYFTPHAMVLITEKVGVCVEQDDDDKIYVGGQVLDEENLMLLEEKGLEGLRTLHEHSVVHYDTAARNTRVEMRDGKIDRVWWVDLGDACEIDEEAEMVWDVEGYRGDYPKGLAIDLDVGVFRRSIREALEAIRS